MTILADWELQKLAVKEGIIKPFVPHQITEIEGIKVPSFGLSSFGYDVRMGNRFIIWEADDHKEVETELSIILQPQSSILVLTMEWIKVPQNCLLRIYGKSTYTRQGLILNATVGEPGWEGNLTLNVFNSSSVRRRLVPGHGIAQLVFERGNQPLVTYANRQGKYQNAKGIQEAK